MVAFAAPIGARFTSPVTFGAALIRINGPRITIPLDGLHSKNMIFENCTLLYSGKTLKLENSGFSNSTFQFGRKSRLSTSSRIDLGEPFRYGCDPVGPNALNQCPH